MKKMICDKFSRLFNALVVEGSIGVVGIVCIITGLLIFGGYVVLYPILATIPLIYIVIGTIGLMEILFLFDKEKPKYDEGHIWFTFKRKILSFFDIVVGIGFFGDLKYVYDQLPTVAEWFGLTQPYLLEFAKYLVIMAIFCMMFYVYIWLNSKKYKKKD
jgi:hypothetical protein